ncbi:MAG: hypothetical protein FJ405_06375 [Verrucomicrobia bacterium]|nr:hypothetical protein [Verrucomicrobiota bacterium]
MNSPTNKTIPQTSGGEFTLRLLIHVDSQGVARLLKEVVQLWRDGVSAADANGFQRLQIPGRYALLTDETLFPQFQGATLRDGSPFGRRFSTVSYDFPSTPAANFLAMEGSPGGTNVLKAVIRLPSQSPSNPFRHKYHPDHDNLDASYSRFKEEAYEVVRTMEFRFSPSPPPDVRSPDYGYRSAAKHWRTY